MFFRKPPASGLFGLPFSQQTSNFDTLTSPIPGNSLLPGEWDWQKKKPHVVDLITGLASMFGRPANQPEFTMEQPTFNLPTTTPPYIARPPQNKTGWSDWMGNWDLQRSDLGDLPEYPSPNDPFALGKRTGDMIRKTWHDVHKDYAYQTIQNNFPDLDISSPQPDQSYHDFFNGIKQQLNTIPPYQLAAMQRSDLSETSNDPELDLRQPPYPDWPQDQMPPSPFDPNRPPSPAPKPEPEEYGPEMSNDSKKPTHRNENDIPRDTNPFPSPREIITKGLPDIAGTVLPDVLVRGEGKELAGLGAEVGTKIAEKIGSWGADKATEKDHEQRLKDLEAARDRSIQTGNDNERKIWELAIKETKNMEQDGKYSPLSPLTMNVYLGRLSKIMDALPAARQKDTNIKKNAPK